MRLSKRALGVSASETLRLYQEVARLRASGRKVVSLLEGEPDLPPPSAAVTATVAALKKGLTRYSPSAGLPELRRELARRHRVRPERVLVTNGAKQAIYESLQALCGPGDEVVIPSPYWVTFPEAVRLAGGTPVFAPMHGHSLDLSAVEAALSPRTRAVLVNTPHNPTGAVYPARELRALARLARARGLWLISDEAYADLVFDRREHASLASFAPERTLTIRTFSKGFSMTGFRVGYVVAPPAAAAALARMHGHMTGNVCTFAQYGALAALKAGRAFHDERRRVFQRRRDLAFALGSKLFACEKPQGAFYLWADARRHDAKSSRLAERLLKGGVAVVPGSACGQEGFLRVSFASSEANIKKGFALMEKVLCR